MCGYFGWVLFFVYVVVSVAEYLVVDELDDFGYAIDYAYTFEFESKNADCMGGDTSRLVRSPTFYDISLEELVELHENQNVLLSQLHPVIVWGHNSTLTSFCAYFYYWPDATIVPCLFFASKDNIQSEAPFFDPVSPIITETSSAFGGWTLVKFQLDHLDNIMQIKIVFPPSLPFWSPQLSRVEFQILGAGVKKLTDWDEDLRKPIPIAEYSKDSGWKTFLIEKRNPSMLYSGLICLCCIALFGLIYWLNVVFRKARIR